jgi:hypothetical protein
MPTDDAWILNVLRRAVAEIAIAKKVNVALPPHSAVRLRLTERVEDFAIEAMPRRLALRGIASLNQIDDYR